MKFLSITLPLLLSLSTALAGGGNVGSDLALKIEKIDCRAGTQFWDENTGMEIDLKKQTAQNYKDNGHTDVGSPFQVNCQTLGNTVECVGPNFELVLNDVTQIKDQSSADASDILGSVFGGSSGKHVKATQGKITKKGFVFTKEKNIVCSIK